MAWARVRVEFNNTNTGGPKQLSQSVAMKLRADVALVNAAETNCYPQQTHREQDYRGWLGQGLGSRELCLRFDVARWSLE